MNRLILESDLSSQKKASLRLLFKLNFVDFTSMEDLRNFPVDPKLITNSSSRLDVWKYLSTLSAQDDSSQVA